MKPGKRGVGNGHLFALTAHVLGALSAFQHLKQISDIGFLFVVLGVGRIWLFC